jgi:hypothetical protein
MKSSLTLVPNDSDVGSCYVKRHEFLCLDDAEVTRTLSSMLAEEANILEALKPHPHRNIFRYPGCITARGRVVGLALERHDTHPAIPLRG